MMGGVSPETCWASYKYGLIKIWYTVASCWIFLWIALWCMDPRISKLCEQHSCSRQLCTLCRLCLCNCEWETYLPLEHDSKQCDVEQHPKPCLPARCLSPPWYLVPCNGPCPMACITKRRQKTQSELTKIFKKMQRYKYEILWHVWTFKCNPRNIFLIYHAIYNTFQANVNSVNLVKSVNICRD